MEGVNTAYKAVMKPAEGTILTVSRLAAERALREANSTAEVDQVLDGAIQAAKEALERTVEQNPVLEKAGVVDAGGYGWVIVLENMHAALTGKKPKSKFNFLPQKPKPSPVSCGELSQFDEGEINYATALSSSPLGKTKSAAWTDCANTWRPLATVWWQWKTMRSSKFMCTPIHRTRRLWQRASNSASC